MNASRVLELKQSVNKHHNNVEKLLMSNKESLERKTQIESALRVYKKTILKLSAEYLSLIEMPRFLFFWLGKTIVADALVEFRASLPTYSAGVDI